MLCCMQNLKYQFAKKKRKFQSEEEKLEYFKYDDELLLVFVFYYLWINLMTQLILKKNYNKI